MDGGEPDRWSAVAEGWARLWGAMAAPVWDAVLDAVAARPGWAVLDVGCGAGDLLVHAAARGLTCAGVDPAPGMLALARARLPGAELRAVGAEALPWPDAAFDLVTAVNALHFADDVDGALAEVVRVLRPGGWVALAGWAEGRLNDLDVVEAVVAEATDEELAPDGDLRVVGGLAGLLADGGLVDVREGLVATPWTAPDDATLVDGVLLGEDGAARARLAPVVVAAAAPFRRPDGGYLLVNHHRWAVGRRPA